VRVLVVYNVVNQLSKGQAEDLIAEQEVADSAEAITQGLISRGYDAIKVPVIDDLAAALAPYDPAECVVFNLIESLDNGRIPETHAAALLENRGFTYTGSPSETLARAMNKVWAKEILMSHGLPIPQGQIFTTPRQRFRLAFPAIVKPVAEDASIGITIDAVVSSLSNLRRRVAYVLETYRQPALVEEFIAGREINVAIWGNDPPEVLPLSELDFSLVENPLHRVCSYETKWIEGSYGWNHIHVVCPVVLEPELRARVERIALDCYQVMGCRDYARVDMRLRGEEIYILEVNPNPALLSGGFVRSSGVAGYDFAATVARIVEFALARRSVGGSGRT